LLDRTGADRFGVRVAPVARRVTGKADMCRWRPRVNPSTAREITSEGELAYRLWRRGLELTVAGLAGLGATLPPDTSEELIANLVAQRLLLCLPLLRRTGTLGLLGIEPAPHHGVPAAHQTTRGSSPKEAAIDAGASDAIVGSGGSDFL